MNAKKRTLLMLMAILEFRSMAQNTPIPLSLDSAIQMSLRQSRQLKVDNAKVDAAFFQGSTWKSNFICNLGYGDASKLRPRAPRLEFKEACKIL